MRARRTVPAPHDVLDAIAARIEAAEDWRSRSVHHGLQPEERAFPHLIFHDIYTSKAASTWSQEIDASVPRY